MVAYSQLLTFCSEFVAVDAMGVAAIGGICGIGGKKKPGVFGGGLSSGVIVGGMPTYANVLIII